MQKAQELELLKRFEVPECSVILKKLENESIVEREGGSQSLWNNQQPEANASNEISNFLVEVVERSRNLNHIFVPERPITPRVLLPEVQLRDASKRKLQPAIPQELSIHARIMDEIKQKLDTK